MYHPASSALQPSFVSRYGLLACAVVLATVGGVFAATLALVDVATVRESLTRLELGALTGANGEAIVAAVGITVFAAFSGTLVGAPLGMASRAQPRAGWSMTLRVLGLVPLALPPLALALGVDRLLENAGLLDTALRAVGFGLTPAHSALALTIAHIPLAAAIVGVVVALLSAGPDAATLETARLLGAGRGRRFLAFELPQALPAIALGATLAFLVVVTSVAALLSLTARANP